MSSEQNRTLYYIAQDCAVFAQLKQDYEAYLADLQTRTQDLIKQLGEHRLATHSDYLRDAITCLIVDLKEAQETVIEDGMGYTFKGIFPEGVDPEELIEDSLSDN